MNVNQEKDATDDDLSDSSTGFENALTDLLKSSAVCALLLGILGVLIQRMLAISNRSALLPHIIKSLDFGAHSLVDQCIVSTHMHAMAEDFRLAGVPMNAVTLGYAVWITAGAISYIVAPRN